LILNTQHHATRQRETKVKAYVRRKQTPHNNDSAQLDIYNNDSAQLVFTQAQLSPKFIILLQQM